MFVLKSKYNDDNDNDNDNDYNNKNNKNKNTNNNDTMISIVTLQETCTSCPAI